MALRGLTRTLALGVGYLIFTAATLGTTPAAAQLTKGNPTVIFSTNLGSFLVELYPDKAPVTVKNFLEYVDSGFFDNTIFHRVVPGFVIQGGG